MNSYVARSDTLPNGGGLTDGLDIDRWENDGGRSLGTRHECVRD